MQNFRTVTIGLHQEMVERIRALPAQRSTRDGRRHEEYRVIDVEVADGRCYQGLLLVREDMLLLPESEPAFESEDIVTVTATPTEQIPGFSITDPDELWENGVIEWGNSIREHLFGPDPEERDWRRAPVDEAHEEALDLDLVIDTYGGEIPACIHGPHLVALVPEGIRVRCVSARTEEALELTLRPRAAAVWRDLLEQEVVLDDAFTFGDLLGLLDLPAEVGREVYLRSVAGAGSGFGPWTRALDRPETAPEVDIEYLEVSVHADWVGEGHAYEIYFDVVGRSPVVLADDPETGTAAGERTPWSVAGLRPSALLHLPIVIDDRLVFPLPHEQTIAFLRGPLRAWHRGGETGPRPEIPVAFRTRYSMTLARVLRALFREIAPEV